MYTIFFIELRIRLQYYIYFVQHNNIITTINVITIYIENNIIYKSCLKKNTYHFE